MGLILPKSARINNIQWSRSKRNEPKNGLLGLGWADINDKFTGLSQKKAIETDGLF
jgi:hypothetical protein